MRKKSNNPVLRDSLSSFITAVSKRLFQVFPLLSELVVILCLNSSLITSV